MQGSVLEAESLFITSDYTPSFDFPWNPDPLARGNNYHIYDEMRSDDQIKAVLSIKKDLVISTGWEIICEDEEIREFITRNLSQIHQGQALDSTFEDVLWDILTSYDYGFSMSEVVYNLTLEKLYGIKAIKVRPPHSFKFHIDPKGEVLEIEQSGVAGTLRFKPDKFLHHVYQQEFGNPFGKSDLQAAHKHWVLKKHFVKFFGIYVERFANPTIVGKYPVNLAPNEITELNNILKSIQNQTTLIVPDNIEIDFQQPNRDASQIYITGLDMLDMRIARSILVPDLLGISGSKTAGGSFSLGAKQFELFMDVIQRDRLSLEKKITQRVIQPMVQANWGDVKCEFKFKPFSDENLLESSKIWSEAVKGRIFKATEEEVNHFRSTVGFPQGSVEITEPQQPSQPFTIESEAKALRTRDKTSYEKKVDFVNVNQILVRSDKELEPELQKATRDIWTDMLDQVRDKKIITQFKPEKMETLKPRFLSPMKGVMNSHFKGLFKQANRDAKREMTSKLRKFVEDDILPEEYLTAMDADNFNLVGGYAKKVDTVVRSAVLKGVEDGLSQAEIFKLLREELTSQSDNWINTTIRTNTTKVYNAGRKTFWDTDKLASSIIEAYQYSAILDSRTTEVCLSLDGKIFNKGELTNRITPPLHLNCRSLLVPVTRFEDFESDPNFRPPSREPSLESLRKKGGRLIIGDI